MPIPDFNIIAGKAFGEPDAQGRRKRNWTQIGVAFASGDGFRLLIDYLPISSDTVIYLRKRRDETPDTKDPGPELEPGEDPAMRKSAEIRQSMVRAGRKAWTKREGY